MTTGRASRNYAGSLFLTWERIRLNTQVARFPLSWQSRLRDKLGRKSTPENLSRWAEVVDKLCASERGGLRPDASDSEICEQADITARDFGRRLRLVAGVARAKGMCERGIVRLQAFFARHLLARRGLLDVWRWKKAKHRPGAVARMECARFWRRVYRRLHARTVEAVAVGIGLVRKTAGLYCSDDAVQRSRAGDLRCTAVLDTVVAVNDHAQAYRLAELAAKGVANQEIRRHELLTRIAGFELIAKECGHFAMMVTVTCPSRFHAAKTTASGQVVDNRKYEDLTPRDGQDYLARQWARCRAMAARCGLEWYGFRIAEPQHDGTPHWHLLLFMPHSTDGLDTQVMLRALFLAYFLDNDSPDEPGAEQYRVDFELIDWARGSAVGYVIKYISKNIDGHGVGVDLFGNDAVTSSQRVRAWAKTWRIRQFQQVGGAPVGIWRELRRVHPDNVPDTAPQPLREAISAMNVAKVEPGVQSLAWAKYTKAQGGVHTCRAALRVKLIKEKQGKKTKYGEPSPDRTVGVWSAGVELFVPEHMAHMKHAAPVERPVLFGVHSERAQWLMGCASVVAAPGAGEQEKAAAVAAAKARALALGAVVFERSRAAASTRIHVNNCTRPDPGARSSFAPVVRLRPKLGVFRRFEAAPGGSRNQLE
ncbi:replication endonuclease [Acidovorax sp. Q11]